MLTLAAGFGILTERLTGGTKVSESEQKVLKELKKVLDKPETAW